MKVALCTPTRAKPSQPYLDAIAASVPVLESAGWECESVWEVGCPYISAARATMLRKALDAKADAIIFLDDDVSWQHNALLKLLQVPDEVVAGTYRFKREPEEYMGSHFTHDNGAPMCRADGLIDMHSIPAGFLKITRSGVNRFIKAFPELCYGEAQAPSIDLFNHGAWDGTWYGEDYAFARRWREKCGKIWLIPNLQIDHHSATECFPGNFSGFLMRQPGGRNDPLRRVA